MKLIVLAFCLAFGLTANAQISYFPPLTGSQWDTVSATSLGWCIPELDSLFAYAGRTSTDALLILKDGKIVREQYYGTFGRDSIHGWNSAGKTLTGFLVGIAQQEGRININSPTSTYLGTGWTSAPLVKENLITVKHQLSMTTGLNDNIAATPSVPDPDNCMTPSCLQYLADAGTRWAYHNAPYRLLQNVVAAATSTTFQIYTRQKVATRIGMNGLWYDYVYYSKTRDMARFGLLILNKGNWNGSQILTDTAFLTASINTSQSINRSYGYLWWLNGKGSFMQPGIRLVQNSDLFPSAPDEVYAGLGKDDQKLYIWPSQKICIVRVGGPGLNSVFAVSGYDDELWRRIRAAVCNVNGTETVTPLSATFGLFPNPSQTMVTLENLPEGEHSYTLLNSLGQVCGSGWVNASSQSINVQSLPKGIYFLKIQNTEGNVLGTRKLIVD